MSVLPHQPSAAARENAGGGFRGGPWKGGCLPLAVQEPDLPDSTGSLNRLFISDPLKPEGASDLEGSGPTGLEIELVRCGGGRWTPGRHRGPLGRCRRTFRSSLSSLPLFFDLERQSAEEARAASGLPWGQIWI
ncbi:hypothetical protein P7K49_023417 [Saguinus oedipus]|uniref:Uncharacterized protein n=1 Tax=Saguinus oedipus TaxID=9490 RepID=A0ABQ9ULJ4_SAGOE|nr:hypothetical protein P7K49_023417 [Saguinus oedipus]